MVNFSVLVLINGREKSKSFLVFVEFSRLRFVSINFDGNSIVPCGQHESSIIETERLGKVLSGNVLPPSFLLLFFFFLNGNFCYM